MRKKRATHKLVLLDQKPGLGAHLQSHRVEVRVHRAGLEYGLYLVEDVAQLDDDVPFLISEFLFNLRSSLDQLAYQLHLRRFRTNRLPDGLEGVPSFPIIAASDPRASQPPERWSGIKHLASKERMAVRQLQPFIGRNDRWKDTREGLALLSALHNIDKHRRLHVAKSIPAIVPMRDRFPSHSGFRQTVFFRPLVAGTEVERWTFAEPTDLVDMNHQVWPEVVIDDATLQQRIKVHNAFGTMLDAVERVLIRFAPLFPKDEPYWKRRDPAFVT